jgi:Zn-dependent M28 family amino/carboxypeptidase
MRTPFSLRIVLGLALLSTLTGCTGSDPVAKQPEEKVAAASLDDPGLKPALDAIKADLIKQHMSTLADDKFEGRGLGTAGYDGALGYVESTLKAYGVEPAGENGGFRQRVPLRNSTVAENQSLLKVTSKGGTRTLAYGVDYMLSADHLRETVSIDDAPVAFVGYGVSAPGLGYDDYASAGDLKGKVVIYLSGAPASLPSNERAYYSSGAVKDAEAVKRGAIGTMSFTSPDDPRFRWDVSVATSKQGSFAWVDAQGQPSRGYAALRGSASLNHSGAAALFAGTPTPLKEVFAAAAASKPQAFDLPTRVAMTTRSTRKEIESANVVGRVKGSDPQLQAEHVVYIAHVDHFGRGVAMNGDAIYNGAHDNASGVAIVLEIAHAATALPAKSRRSALFLFVTAEERGLLGSDYFARHPTVPKESLVADMTLDMPFLFHPLLDIVPYGAQHSTLLAPVTKAAQHLGIGLAEDPIPEQVLFIRSDHFSFVRQGIPSLFIKSGFKTGDARDGSQINATYRRDVYHKPNDDMTQAFDFEAGVAHARLNFLTGWLIAQETTRPAWNPGDFFGKLFGGQAPAAPTSSQPR